jgi:ribosomal protein S10
MSSVASKSGQVLDELIKRLVVHVKGHDRAVLDSYSKFVQMTATELNVKLGEVREPDRFIERWTVLKSRFSNRKVCLIFFSFERKTYL